MHMGWSVPCVKPRSREKSSGPHDKNGGFRTVIEVEMHFLHIRRNKPFTCIHVHSDKSPLYRLRIDFIAFY